MSDADEPYFDEPWQATAYAMMHMLVERGLFSRDEWAENLGRNLRKRPDDDGRHYYTAFLETIEALLAAKGAAGANELLALKEAWRHAYESTPHGRPVELRHD